MFDYLKYRYVCYGFFVLLVISASGAYWYNLQRYGSGFNYSVDFTGGTQVLLQLDKPISAEKINHILQQANLAQGLEIRELAGQQILIRIQEFSADVKGIGTKITEALQREFGDKTVELLQTDSVGSAVGGTLRTDSLKAILIALLLMLLYVGIRFKFAFSVGAVLALFHDALVILTFFLLTNREISVDVIGAILMTLGYSVNDTIVIFSRIRENLKKMQNASIEYVVNLSIQQTLRRTILTSISTALVVCSLIAFGGEMLRGLSLALLLGIICGTYSSIFVASPIMLLLYKKNTAN